LLSKCICIRLYALVVAKIDVDRKAEEEKMRTLRRRKKKKKGEEKE